MQETTYMKDRVDDQMDWYSRKSGKNKTYHIWSNGLIIFFGAMIPFVAGAEGTELVASLNLNTNFLVGGLGVCTATFSGVQALMKFEEKWTVYRTTSEALRREKWLYETHTHPYTAGKASFNLFVKNVETILGQENRTWSELVSSKEPSTDAGSEA